MKRTSVVVFLVFVAGSLLGILLHMFIGASAVNAEQLQQSTSGIPVAWFTAGPNFQVQAKGDFLEFVLPKGITDIVRFGFEPEAGGTLTLTTTFTDPATVRFANGWLFVPVEFDQLLGPIKPDAMDDTAVAFAGQEVVIDVAANDNDPNGNLKPETANSLCAFGSNGCNGAANGGTLSNNLDGTITYIPGPGYTGEDYFAYEICDAGFLCDTANVTVTVGSIGEQP